MPDHEDELWTCAVCQQDVRVCDMYYSDICEDCSEGAVQALCGTALGRVRYAKLDYKAKQQLETIVAAYLDAGGVIEKVKG